MTADDFTIRAHRTGDPFRRRETFEEYVAFDGADGRVAFVAGDDALMLRHRAGVASPNETGGLLFGRRYHDDAGAYAVVLGHLEAPSRARGISSIHLSPDVVDGLQKLAARVYPGLDLVGWWHSHSAPSPFSATDHETQQVFTNAVHVGLLVYARGLPWALAYQGPTAAVLTSRTDMPTAVQTVPVDPSVRRADRYGLSERPNGAPHPNVGPGARAPRASLVGLAIAACALLVSGVAITIAAIGARPSGTRSETGLAWGCTRTADEVALTCAASAPAGRDVEWALNGHRIGAGTRITFPDPSTGRISVRTRPSTFTASGDLDVSRIPGAATPAPPAAEAPSFTPPTSTTTQPGAPSSPPTATTGAPPAPRTTGARRSRLS